MLASTIAPIANVSLDKKNSLDMDTFLNRETELRQRIVPGVGKIKLTLKFDGVQVIFLLFNNFRFRHHASLVLGLTLCTVWRIWLHVVMKFPSTDSTLEVCLKNYIFPMTTFPYKRTWNCVLLVLYNSIMFDCFVLNYFPSQKGFN